MDAGDQWEPWSSDSLCKDGSVNWVDVTRNETKYVRYEGHKIDSICDWLNTLNEGKEGLYPGLFLPCLKNKLSYPYNYLLPLNCDLNSWSLTQIWYSYTVCYSHSATSSRNPKSDALSEEWFLS